MYVSIKYIWNNKNIIFTAMRRCIYSQVCKYTQPLMLVCEYEYIKALSLSARADMPHCLFNTTKYDTQMYGRVHPSISCFIYLPFKYIYEGRYMCREEDMCVYTCVCIDMCVVT